VDDLPATVRSPVVLRTVGLGRRYGRTAALHECSFELPAGRVAALVGPNGAGKSTLMRIATGLVAPTAGRIEVLGQAPGRRGMPRGLSYLAQDTPLYRRFRVGEMLRAAAALNDRPGGRWDAEHARHLVERAMIPLDAVIGSLSGGQRTRVALALALGRRPELLLLDEPLADLDPLARRQVLAMLLADVAGTGLTVLMSSHVVADIEDVCDHLVLLRGGRVWLAGEIEALLAGHRLVRGAQSVVHTRLPADSVVVSSTAGRQRTALVRGIGVDGDGLQVEPPTLEELVLAYLSAPAEPAGHSTGRSA
jgi:ABC-2 type transport system ATP-binding protein